MRPVPVFIPRVAGRGRRPAGVLPGEVGAVDVVDDAVLVVVDAVARDLPRVGPDIVAQVLVVVVDARVDDGHDDRRRPDPRRPPPGRGQVVHAPQLGQEGIVRDRGGGAPRGPGGRGRGR